MRRTKFNELDGIVSWLKYFDLEYLSESLFSELSSLSADDSTTLERAVVLAVLPEFRGLNEVSKTSMLRILDLAISVDEHELKPYFDRICMPFSPLPSSPHAFLVAIHDCIHNDEKSL